ncbi:hypothetical protein [Streptomyces sp. A3M-1-3]|nr:hypothetical protein [Streptomyces sp. A3M-1-3]
MSFGTRLACFVHYRLTGRHIAALFAYIAGSIWLGHRLWNWGNPS